jgi:hypothetical protein
MKIKRAKHSAAMLLPASRIEKNKSKFLLLELVGKTA